MDDLAKLPAWAPEDLVAWRRRLDLSQAQAAEVLGVHVHALKNWEYGKRRISMVVRRLAEAIERERQPGAAPSTGPPCP